MQNLFKDLEQLLLQCDDYNIDGKLNKPKIEEQALALEPQLLKILLNHDGLKKHFFQDVDSLLVFDKVKFQKFISNKQFLPDSYTQFKNKIGLTANGTYLTESKEVVLDFPYKDCVLQGCQDKEDAKRNEIFFNETLAPDDIDMLLEPKVLTNFKKHDATGEHKVINLSTQDNLIIKGNNLLALHSLLSVYRGKVKLIYIDPPYYFNAKKKEDTFAYNSNFKLSSWLTFMKNRLEVVRDLLSFDGAIYVQISDDGVGMLQELLKNVFNTVNENNFINKITVKTKSPSGFASVNAGVFESAEYILSFAKNKKNWTYKPQFVKSEYDDNYKWYIENKDDNYESWRIIDLFEYIAHINNFKNKQDAIKNLKENVFLTMVADFALEHADCVCRYTEIGDDAAKEIVDARELSKCDLKIYQVKRSDHYNVYIYKGREIAFYLKKIRQIDGEMTPSIQLSNIWIDTPYEGIAREGGVKLKGGKKPEKLIRRIIEMSTNQGDIVLDYHLGSGTTAAVAHKMGRQYIGIEQMDYIEDLAVTRLKKVIGRDDETKDLLESETIYKDFDSSGISKAVNWQGGGSFVYCELKQNNQRWVDKIINAVDRDELLNIWQIMQNKAQLSYKVDVKNINNSADDFKQLSLGEQKQFLLEIIDKNQLYVNYTEIEDVDYQCSEEEENLNNIFYGLK